MNPSTSKSQFSSLKSMFSQKQENMEENKYIHREFQDYGYQLAERLGDLSHKALYIKLAKSYPRSVLESAYSFVADYPKAQSKGKLFMWKLKQLREIKPQEVKPNI